VAVFVGDSERARLVVVAEELVAEAHPAASTSPSAAMPHPGRRAHDWHRPESRGPRRPTLSLDARCSVQNIGISDIQLNRSGWGGGEDHLLARDGHPA
jgi:hypothetical protein